MTVAPVRRAVPRAMRDSILAWYAASGRSLPFRGTADPYAVLVSEVMAQQTQISRVSEAWSAWLDRFPTVDSLAAASPADVLRQWAGLGYNRRAIALWRLAREVVDRHGGRLPAGVDVLMTLPGVGPYTARAVAAIAFGQRVGAVDTNVRRVLARSVAGDAAGLAPGELQELADDAVPREDPATWTHALMDVGATFCRPRRPRCEACPAAAWCAFAAAGRTADRAPRPRPRPSTPFVATTRWLRGRIVARAREAGGGWTAFDEPIGDHGRTAVRRALLALEQEGMIELDEAGRARLPLA